MLALILALLQEGHAATGEQAAPGQAVAEHAAETAHKSEPWLVEQVNHIFGPVVVKIEQAIMPSIYGLFGKQWHEPAPGELVIPEHVVWVLLLFVICVAGVFLMRGRLSVDRPSKGQQVLELVVEQLRELLDQVIGPYGRRYLPVIGSFAVFILIGNLMGFIPGLGAPTESINVTGALGLSSFLYYMGMGFRQQGIKYLKHFTGGLTGVMLIVLGPLIFLVETTIQQCAPGDALASPVCEYVCRPPDRRNVLQTRAYAGADFHDRARAVCCSRADVYIHNALDGLPLGDRAARRTRYRGARSQRAGRRTLTGHSRFLFVKSLRRLRVGLFHRSRIARCCWSLAVRGASEYRARGNHTQA